ncbi:MAG: hypothetical protein PHH85_01915 [Candidatus Methanoperedens sp.]|nr:hypothetical protein [Candidatus Methanoperedens sp.]
MCLDAGTLVFTGGFSFDTCRDYFTRAVGLVTEARKTVSTPHLEVRSIISTWGRYLCFSVAASLFYDLRQARSQYSLPAPGTQVARLTRKELLTDLAPEPVFVHSINLSVINQ